MKKVIAKIFGALMVAALCFLAVGVAFAEPATMASDERLEFGAQTVDFGAIAESGHSFTRDLALTNKGGDVLAVDLSVQSYDNDSLDNSWKVADGWLVFVDARNHFEIAPGETATVGLRMMVPNEVAGGTYYATIMAKTDAGEAAIPVTIDVATDGYKKSGELVSNTVAPLVVLINDTDSLCKALRAEVKNTGTAQMHTSYSLTEENAFGLADERTAATNEDGIVQGETKSLLADNCQTEKKGLIKVIQKIQYENADGKTVVSVLERRVLVLPLIALIAIAVAIVAIIILAIIIHKLKLKKLMKQKNEETEL